MPDIEQWVNLEKDSKFVGDEIPSLERIGFVQIRCRFRRASLASFRIKVFYIGDYEGYSAAERGRNENFQVRAGGSATNGGNQSVDLTKEIYLSAAGGNKFKIKAKYRNTVVESGKVVVTRRKLWYQVQAMRSLTAPSLSDMEDEYWKPAKNHYIKLHKEGATATIPYQKTILKLLGSTSAAQTQMMADSGRAYTLRNLHPYAFVAAFVNYIGRYETRRYTWNFPMSIPSVIGTWDPGMEQFNLVLPPDKYLWFGLSDAEDAVKYWFVSGRMWFIPQGGTAGDSLAIHRADISIRGADHFPLGGKNGMKVRVNPADFGRNVFSSRQGTLRMQITVRQVERFLGGYSLGSTAFVCVACKCWWRIKRAPGMVQTMVHEIGHKVGMMPPGTGRYPDATSTYYTGQGHVGGHCSTGATWNAGTSSWSGTPGCVMFGSTGLAGHATPKEFCATCNPAVRKLDLHSSTLTGTGFGSSV